MAADLQGATVGDAPNPIRTSDPAHSEGAGICYGDNNLQVSRLAEAHLAKVEMDIDEMCLTASRIGRARVSQLFAPRVNGDDWTLLHPTELPDDVSEAVQSIEVHRDPDGGEHFKYKMHPKLQALDLIAKLRGLVAKKTELDVVLTWRQVLEKMDAEDAIEAEVKEVGSPSGTTTAGDRAQ